MSMFSYRRDEKTDREIYLEGELERYREDENRRMEDERREQERRQAERLEELEERMRMADTWPEALRKQIHLFNHEIAAEVKMNREFGLEATSDDPEIDNWFRDGVKACERALEIWYEVAAENSARIDALKRKIEAILEETKETVAAKLEEENNNSGWKEVARALREDTPSNWLCW